MAQFIYFVRPARPGFQPDNVTEREAQIVGEHFAYLQKALAEGSLILVGRTQEEPWVGICVFEAPDREAAEAFMNNDPAVAQGVFNGTFQSYSVALMRGCP